MKRYPPNAMISTLGGIAAAIASVATLAILVALPATYAADPDGGPLAKRRAAPVDVAASHHAIRTGTAGAVDCGRDGGDGQV